MKKKLLQTCLFLTLFGLMLTTPIARVSAQSTEWNLQVTNGTTTINYTYDQLLALPETTVYADLYCSDGVLVEGGNWEGVSLSYLLQQVGVIPTVNTVSFLASDGYRFSLSIQGAMQPDIIIAYELDGLNLPEVLRLVVPGEVGSNWIGLITSITMSTLTPSETPASPTNQPSTQPTQPQPTAAPINENSTEPTTLPANVTQPAQKVSIPQGSNPEGLGFPVVAVYGIAIGATIALAATGYLTYKRRFIKRRT